MRRRSSHNRNMRSKLYLVAGLALAAVLGIPQSVSMLVGKKAPAITVKSVLNGAKAPVQGTNLAKLKGRVVVLDFWAFW